MSWIRGDWEGVENLFVWGVIDCSISLHTPFIMIVENIVTIAANDWGD